MVERPNLNKIVPTTWRRWGSWFTGKFSDYSLKYQLYLTKDFYLTMAQAFLEVDGYRKGRQKGIQSIISSLTFQQN